MTIETLDETRLDELLAILRRRAQWLIERGMPMWNPAYLEPEAFVQRYHHPLCFLALENQQTIGGFILVERDDVLWKGHSQEGVFYVHKLVIDHDFRGRGLVPPLVDQIVAYARAHRRHTLRLDNYHDRPYLNSLYGGLGFDLVDVKVMPDGTAIALRQKNLGPVPQT